MGEGKRMSGNRLTIGERRGLERERDNLRKKLSELQACLGSPVGNAPPATTAVQASPDAW